MDQSPQIEKLMAAFCAAQGAMGKAQKDSTNPFHKSKYADLESVWDTCKTALHENGLCLLQNFETVEGAPHLITFLGHSSGQFMRSKLKLPFPFDVVDKNGQVTHKNDPQALGSVTTYCRRYALAAMMGIVQTDDDAQEAMKPAPQPIKKAEPPANTGNIKASSQPKKKPEETLSNPFDSPLAQLQEYMVINGLDTNPLLEFIASRAVAKKTSPEKIIESALLSPDMTKKFAAIYSDYLNGGGQLAATA